MFVYENISEYKYHIQKKKKQINENVNKKIKLFSRYWYTNVYKCRIIINVCVEKNVNTVQQNQLRKLEIEDLKHADIDINNKIDKSKNFLIKWKNLV